MKNKELYEKKVEEGSLVRYEINEDHSKEISILGKIYKGYFNRNPGEFKVAKDIRYYTGGWPKEDTPAKAKQLANKIADAYMILSFIGYSADLNMYLMQRGLQLVPYDGDVQLDDHSKFYAHSLLEDLDWKSDKKRRKLVEDNWNALFDYDVPTDPKEMLKALIDRACDKQARICELSDEIKIDMGEEVQSECEIKVGNFTRAVNLKYQIQKGKDVTEIVDKIVKDSEGAIESIEIF
jgi:hypothetical protein